jgi:putative phage-type endonuclease
MKIHNIPQHLDDGQENPAWIAMRAGKFTASDFHQYLGILKDKGLADTAEKCLCRKILAGLGYSFSSFKNEIMEAGNELEPIAREMYIQETFNDVQEIGFADWEQLRAGCSPDGVIYGADGQIDKIIEIKCPEILDYVRYAQDIKHIPNTYITQMQYNMLITGAKSCDFVAYHPNMRLVVHTIDADSEYQAKIVAALEKLNERYDEILATINKLKVGE